MSAKTPFELLDLDFAAAMCENFAAGVAQDPDREPNGWQTMDWDSPTESLYEAKILRHLHEWRRTRDPRHLAAIACDANIIWTHAEKKED